MAKVAPIMDVDPTLAHVYNEAKFQPGWWASEKMDGVRALWVDGRLVTRTGRLIHAPASFLVGLPQDMNLDGELFEGRGMFDKTAGTVRKHHPRAGEHSEATFDYVERWAGIKFHAFDTYGGRDTYRVRLTALHDMKEGGNQDNYSVVIVPQTVIETVEELEAYIERLVDAGAEGAMLRYPEMHYDFGRTRNLLKCKRFFDMDAVVTRYVRGKGRNVGRVGALMCYANGRYFKVGTGLSDAQREEPPLVGSTIIVKYHEITKAGVPRFPVYVGQRAD